MHVSHQKKLTPLEAFFLRAPEGGLGLSVCEYPGWWRSLACASLESESQGCSQSRGVAAELRAPRLGKMNAISGSEKKKSQSFWWEVSIPEDPQPHGSDTCCQDGLCPLGSPEGQGPESWHVFCHE